MRFSRLIFAVGVLFLATSAHAAPVYTDATAGGAGSFAPFTVSNTDLLQTNLASVSSSGASSFTQEGNGGVPILNNGAFSITGVGGNNPELATGDNGTFVEFNLDTAVNTLGYNITGITTYGGWNDSGRDLQLFNISYSVVGSPLFTAFDSANHDNSGAGGNPTAIRAVFTASLTNVDAIRFDFPNGQENGHAGYGEFDVFGAAVPTPEPSSIALLAAGLVGLVAMARRRK